MISQQKIANILRTKLEVILDLEQKMEKITSKTGIMDKIVIENNILIKRLLSQFGIFNHPSYEQVFEQLISHLEFTDKNLFEFLDRPNFDTIKGCNKLIEEARKLVPVKNGFFIKKNVAEKFLPQNTSKKYNKIFRI